MNVHDAAVREAPARVLVIDDEPLMRKLLGRLLTASGYEVVVTEGGAEAIELLWHSAFDLVVSDVNMPGVDGIEVLRFVRQRDPDLPVILVTACASTDTAIGAVQHHATAYMTKPIDTKRFQEEVAQALTMHKLARVRREAHAVLSTKHDIGQEALLTATFNRALAGVFMAYQPIVCWSQRTIFGYEALVRSSEKELPHPGALFGAADKLDRSRDLGRVIRRKSIEPFVGKDAALRLFLNLHAQDLLDETLFEVESPLVRIANQVVLEITERAQLETVVDVSNRVARLRELGFKVAIDDIGAGYSGLTSFALLKPDMVKLDMALVRDIDKDPVKRRLASLVIQLCRDLGIEVVGEGVETRQERDVLIELGCDLLQGYLFGRPSPPFCSVAFEDGR
jgi:EAL domain-containing protein (putative c-di-GMP-specific phosphodiesterase class I)